MWMECAPGGKLLMSSLIRTPGAASVSVAVPMLCPEAFLMSTITGLGAAFAVELDASAMASAIAKHPSVDKIRILPSPADCLLSAMRPFFRVRGRAIHKRLV